MDAHPGDSAAQRNAETVALALLSQELGVALRKHTFTLPNGGRLEIDAVSDTPPVLCEIWAHQGTPKSAQKAKVMTDAMKLIYARSLSPSGAIPTRLIFAFSDQQAAAHFRGKSWMGAALDAAGIEVMIVDLPEDVRLAVQQAQKNQFR